MRYVKHTDGARHRCAIWAYAVSRVASLGGSQGAVGARLDRLTIGPQVTNLPHSLRRLDGLRHGLLPRFLKYADEEIAGGGGAADVQAIAAFFEKA